MSDHEDDASRDDILDPDLFQFNSILIRLAESCGTTHATPHAASEQNLLTELIQTKQVLHDREANLMLASEIGQALVDRLHRQQQTTQEIADERDELHAAIPQLQSELHTYREYIEDLKQRNAELLGLRASGAEATALSTEELDLSVDSIASISSLKSPDSRNMRRWASASTLPNLPVPTTPDDSLSEVEEFLRRELGTKFQDNQFKSNWATWTKQLRRERREKQVAIESLEDAAETAQNEKQQIMDQINELNERLKSVSDLRLENDDLQDQLADMREQLIAADLSFQAELRRRTYDARAESMELVTSLQNDVRSERDAKHAMECSLRELQERHHVATSQLEFHVKRMARRGSGRSPAFAASVLSSLEPQPTLIAPEVHTRTESLSSQIETVDEDGEEDLPDAPELSVPIVRPLAVEVASQTDMFLLTPTASPKPLSGERLSSFPFDMQCDKALLLSSKSPRSNIRSGSPLSPSLNLKQSSASSPSQSRSVPPLMPLNEELSIVIPTESQPALARPRSQTRRHSVFGQSLPQVQTTRSPMEQNAAPVKTPLPLLSARPSLAVPQRYMNQFSATLASILSEQQTKPAPAPIATAGTPRRRHSVVATSAASILESLQKYSVLPSLQEVDTTTPAENISSSNDAITANALQNSVFSSDVSNTRARTPSARQRASSVLILPSQSSAAAPVVTVAAEPTPVRHTTAADSSVASVAVSLIDDIGDISDEKPVESTQQSQQVSAVHPATADQVTTPIIVETAITATTDRPTETPASTQQVSTKSVSPILKVFMSSAGTPVSVSIEFGQVETSDVCRVVKLLSDQGGGTDSAFLRRRLNRFCTEWRLALTLLANQRSRPPVWTDDASSSSCALCASEFGFFRRRHHCRACGGLCCFECSSRQRAIPKLGLNSSERVCDLCYAVFCDAEQARLQ